MPKSEARSYDDFSYSVAEREKGSSGSLSPFTYLCTLLILSLLGLIILYSSSYKQAIDSSLPHYFFFFRNLIAGISGLAAGTYYIRVSGANQATNKYSLTWDRTNYGPAMTV